MKVEELFINNSLLEMAERTSIDQELDSAITCLGYHNQAFYNTIRRAISRGGNIIALSNAVEDRKEIILNHIRDFDVLNDIKPVSNALFLLGLKWPEMKFIQDPTYDFNNLSANDMLLRIQTCYFKKIPPTTFKTFKTLIDINKDKILPELLKLLKVDLKIIVPIVEYLEKMKMQWPELEIINRSINAERNLKG